jgi:UDP-N-acetyl-D-mannosaminuronate dehydrogenase
MSKAIGIIGLGRIGLPVSEAYLKAGYEVYGYDIREEAVKAFELLSTGNRGTFR